MTDAEIEREVKSLTLEEQADLVGLGRSLSAKEAGRYIKRGLMRIGFDQHGIEASLTPLGLAVRSYYLQREQAK